MKPTIAATLAVSRCKLTVEEAKARAGQEIEEVNSALERVREEGEIIHAELDAFLADMDAFFASVEWSVLMRRPETTPRRGFQSVEFAPSDARVRASSLPST